jgi:hypothetical protein
MPNIVKGKTMIHCFKYCWRIEILRIGHWIWRFYLSSSSGMVSIEDHLENFIYEECVRDNAR